MTSLSPSRTQAQGGPFSTMSLVLVTAAGAAALALMTATQIYLAMWNHGHSFVRMVVWQLALWAFWSATAPWVLRLVGRGTRAPVLAPLGLGLVLLHLVAAGVATSWLTPFAVVGE